jgi:acetyl esterase
VRESFRERLRRRAGAVIVDNIWRTLANAGRLHPGSDPAKHGVEVLRDVRYVDSAHREHLLDVYRKPGIVNAPVVLYVHGGGFRILSKDTHWVMGLAYARMGFVVFNVGYRLAPRHRFPAGLVDVMSAWSWVLDHAAEYGGDPTRVVVAGESAGANLVTSLTIASCYARPEPWARAVFERAQVPRATVAACGILQVTEPERLVSGDGLFRRFLHDRVREVGHAYLGPDARAGDRAIELADPLLVLERGETPARPLPPFFVPCGTWDPVRSDSRRLGAALAGLGVPHEVRFYEGEPHAFHALVFRKNARRCWRHTFAFLDRMMPAAPT